MPAAEVLDGLFGELAGTVQYLVQPRARHLQADSHRDGDVLFSQFLQIHKKSVEGEESGVVVGGHECQFLTQLADDLGHLGKAWNLGFLRVIRRHSGLNGK